MSHAAGASPGAPLASSGGSGPASRAAPRAAASAASSAGVDTAEPPGPWGWRLLATLSTALPLAVAGYGVVAMLALIAGQFHEALVLPLGLAAAAVAVLLGGLERAPAGREARACGLAALVAAVGAAVINAHYHSQDIVVTRDPSVYATTGQYLIHHASLKIQTHPQIFGVTNPRDWSAAGYGLVGFHGELYAQGYHYLPALLASAGWLVGGYHALVLPALLGGAALLAFYGFTCRVVRPRWALLVTLLLAGSMPEIFYSRDTYTEILDQLLIFGGLSLLWRAHRGRRLREAALAGLVIGAGTMSRIDGYLFLDLLVPVLAYWLTLTAAGQRARALGWVAVLAAVAAVPAVISVLDGRWLSPQYVVSLRSSVHQEWVLGIGLTVLSGLAVTVVWSMSALAGGAGGAGGAAGAGGRVRVGMVAFWARLGAAWRALAPLAAAGVVLVVSGYLAARPLWQVATSSKPNVNIGLAQAAAHLAVQPNRTYAEHTVTWLTWYYGVPAIVLGGLGLALLAGRMLRDRPEVAPLVVLTFGVGVLYLADPRITPEQLFAFRRFVPIVAPGLLVGAAAILDLLPAGRTDGPAGEGSRASRASRAVPSGRGRAVVTVLSVAAVAVLLVPAALTTRPLVRVVNFSGEESVVSDLCGVLPPHAAVLFLDSFGQEGEPTERAYCGHPAAELAQKTPVTAAQLVSVQRSVDAHGDVLVVISRSAEPALAEPGDPPRLLVSLNARVWRQSLVSAPSSAVQDPFRLYVSRVTVNGLLTGPGGG